MRKKINLQFMLIAAMSILLTLAMVVGVFYKLFKREVMENIKTYAHVLGYMESAGEIESYAKQSKSEDLRITIIDSDGSVIYDSNANIDSMDNHKHRMEVESAFSKGEGQAIRRSNTMEKNTFYYAIRLSNDSVLRVAKEVDSIIAIFYSAVPSVVGILLMLFVLCALLARVLTGSILSPINQMAADISHCNAEGTYKELVPFITTIQKQHEDIIKNASMRQDFTANVSHELKTPLTAISGYSELIENGMVSEEDIYRFASEIHKSSNRLLGLINDIIRLSELDTVDLEVQFENLNLYEVAESCVSRLQMNAKLHNVTITLSGDTGMIYGNKEMMEELVFNLCDNAIRYNNPEGKVEVSVNTVKDHVVLSVKDTGIGISKEDQERIYERFYRVDRSRSKVKGGTGLGLAIVKHIVAQHKAELHLESDIGRGTMIQVIF